MANSEKASFSKKIHQNLEAVELENIQKLDYFKKTILKFIRIEKVHFQQWCDEIRQTKINSKGDDIFSNNTSIISPPSSGNILKNKILNKNDSIIQNGDSSMHSFCYRSKTRTGSIQYQRKRSLFDNREPTNILNNQDQNMQFSEFINEQFIQRQQQLDEELKQNQKKKKLLLNKQTRRRYSLSKQYDIDNISEDSQESVQRHLLTKENSDSQLTNSQNQRERIQSVEDALNYNKKQSFQIQQRQQRSGSVRYQLNPETLQRVLRKSKTSTLILKRYQQNDDLKPNN